jgi:Holliday junction resolvase
MPITFWTCVVLFSAALLLACAGKGEVVMLDVHARPPAAEQTAASLRALVLPFEDVRVEKGWLGSRTHLWGGETYFDVPGGRPGEVVAKVLAEYLREHGWQVTFGIASSRPSGDTKPDVTVTGQVVDLAANAKSRFGSTRMTVRVNLALQALNAADGSTAHLTVNGARTESEMWFEPALLAAAVNEVLYESLDKLMAETKVENRTLQVR